jgi:hypothetical protein
MKKKSGKDVHTSQALKTNTLPMTIQKQNQESKEHNRISNELVFINWR